MITVLMWIGIVVLYFALGLITASIAYRQGLDSRGCVAFTTLLFPVVWGFAIWYAILYYPIVIFAEIAMIVVEHFNKESK